MQPFELTLTEAAAAIRTKELSPSELTHSVLERITAVDARLGAYVSVVGDAARHAAAQAEREIAAGRHRGPLHGVPFGLKDLIDVAGLPTTASSRVRADHMAEADSTVAARLFEAGAVLVGKTHTHEFAYGLTTPQSRNAWDHGRVAGGSSGGSAVAVAAGAATFALGTDTGGSIRVPAALNGLVGLKPTYGLLPRHGVTPLSWSLDHVGPLTRTVQDAALVLAALTGHDSRDPASLRTGPASDVLPADGGLRGLRVGVPATYYFERVTPEVEAAVRGAIERLRELGAELVEVDIPMARYVLATHWGLMVPEASAYHEWTMRSVPGLYGSDIRVLLEAGELVTAGDYLRAQRARTLMRQEWAQVRERVDVIAAPTVPMTAAMAGQESVEWQDGTVEGVSDAYVRLSAPANITGMPSLTLPVGRDGAGLPIGMQLMGAPLAEATLLRVGQAYEAAYGAPAVPAAVLA
ncbi:amidase [Streptomyces zagrosensis]|uniref:Aspartyl-tRNA(Asn)/glutamyl-tRNA(Gln) amidotransferase subunit A n=1 Tax=Streptomyces zagrosensis TaxID=1042984 RepID=A0A7W9UZ33_9ACTN|nr:amidase [Streptomyces zagrosensis]MBB5936573.1 aspartyl-tRNA(Asn)/glutamyl-tRNA(Gln) amidotransferase subunit A [Streptomyces zagrosensis]